MILFNFQYLRKKPSSHKSFTILVDNMFFRILAARAEAKEQSNIVIRYFYLEIIYSTIIALDIKWPS